MGEAPPRDGNPKNIVAWLDWLFERDPIGHAPAVFDYIHHQIHDQNFWTFGTRLPALNGSVSYLYYNVGTALKAHFEQFLNSDGAVRGFWYQDPTVVAPGTLLGDPPIFNHYQGGGTPLALEIYHNPNISDPGTLRIAIEIGAAGPGPQSFAGSGATREEFIFDNEKYWLAVIDTDGAQIVNYEASWYEKE